MQKLFKVKKVDSKYAWASLAGVDSEGIATNDGFTINHEDAATYISLGLIRVSAGGNTAMLLATPKLQPAINPETNASVGNRIIGFDENSINNSLLLKTAYAKLAKAATELSADDKW